MTMMVPVEAGLAVGCEGDGGGDAGGGGASLVVMDALATVMAVLVVAGLATANESGAVGAKAGGGCCMGQRWPRLAARSHIRIAMRHIALRRMRRTEELAPFRETNQRKHFSKLFFAFNF